MRRVGLTIRRGARIGRHTLALAGMVALAACDGPNRFSGPVDVTQTRPRVEITRPATDGTSIGVTESIVVAAEVRDDEAIDSVIFYGRFLPTQEELERGEATVTEKFNRVVVTDLANPRSDSIGRELFPAEEELKRIASVIVEAYDPDGNLGADTVLVQIGGPTVRLLDLADGQRVRPGQVLTLRALVQDTAAGIASMDFTLSGAIDSVIPRTFTPATDSTIVERTITLPATPTTGTIEVTAGAQNTLSPPLSGRTDPINLVLTDGSITDNVPPQVALTVAGIEPQPARVELGDSIEVTITGSDPTGDGVVLTGFTAIVAGASLGDTVITSGEIPEPSPNQGAVQRTFWLPILAVDSLSLPDTLTYEVTGYMEDLAGNCGATVSETPSSLECTTLGTGETAALDEVGFTFSLIVVAGKTVLLPQGGTILDAEVDVRPATRRLFLSNFSRGQVEVFDLQTNAFRTPIRVAAGPWGLTFNPGRDSLWVANSATTSFSKIDLDTETEIDAQRLQTPDVRLYDVTREVNSESGEIQYNVIPRGVGDEAFSDRPQFVATDEFGNLIYSTVTTGAGELGTVRKAYLGVGYDQAESKLLVDFPPTVDQVDSWAVAHADSARRLTDFSGVFLFDHPSGTPTALRQDLTFTGLNSPAAAPFFDADTRISAGSWDLSRVALSDTTYVAGAADGSFVVIGEGGDGDGISRVLVYRARTLEQVSLSTGEQVEDLLNNASEDVRGVAMNHDGSLAAARGDAAYFFDTNLRLYNTGNVTASSGSQGIAFHPLHASFPSAANTDASSYQPDTHLAFVPTGDNAIDIIDTQRGGDPIGRVTIKDVINGPLKAIQPYRTAGGAPLDNAGRSCSLVPVTDRSGAAIGNAVQIYNGGNFNDPIAPDGISDDACVVVRLFATTTAGGVVIIPVTKADILRQHPVRLAN